MIKHEKMYLYPNKPIRFYDLKILITSIQEFDPDQWVVQPKWDGHRALIFCDEMGKITVYSRHKTPLTLAKNNWNWLSVLPLKRPWLLDGELTRDQRMRVWDYAYQGKSYDWNLPYGTRIEKLSRQLKKQYKKGDFTFELIQTQPFLKYRELLNLNDTYLEGLVFKNLQAIDLWGLHQTHEKASQIKFRLKVA